MADMPEGAIPANAEVLDADGDRMGSVIAAADDFIVVERGFFFPTDCYVPRTVIAEIADGAVRLNMTKEAIAEQGWEVRRNNEQPEVEPAMPTT